MASDDSNIYAGTAGGGVFFSTNRGNSWNPVHYVLNYTYDLSLGVDARHLYVGTQHGLYVFGKSGPNWNLIDTALSNYAIWSVLPAGNKIFVGSDGGAFVSADSGLSWAPTNAGMAERVVFSLATDGPNLFAGTLAGTYYSTDNGSNWNPASEGLSDSTVVSLVADSAYLYAGTLGGGVWKRAISDIVTSVQSPTSRLPHQYVLDQNYPNPFNPSTKVRYRLPVMSRVRLQIFNTLGQLVATLADGIETPGFKSTEWNAGNVPSGMYFCSFTSQGIGSTISYHDVKKMVLVR